MCLNGNKPTYVYVYESFIAVEHIKYDWNGLVYTLIHTQYVIDRTLITAVVLA